MSALAEYERALAVAAEQGNVEAAREIAEQMSIFLRRGNPMIGDKEPLKLGRASLPKHIKEEVRSGFKPYEQALAGAGSAPMLAMEGLRGLVGADNPENTEEQRAIQGASGTSMLGNLIGNAAMFAAVPGRMGSVPTLFGRAPVLTSRPSMIMDTGLTAGILNAATEPGSLSERAVAGVLGAGSATAPVLAMGAAQGGRRTLTGRGRALASGEALYREIGDESGDVIQALKTPYQSVPGVRGSSAVVTGNPRLAALETGSRVNAPAEWIPFDEANAAARLEALQRGAGTAAERQALEGARDAVTSASRDEALTAVKTIQGMSRAPAAERIQTRLSELSTGEHRPNPSIKKVVAYVQSELDQHLTPEQLYTVRKMLTGNVAKGTNDELTNAAKSVRRETMGLVAAIDDALDDLSGGLWRDYLKSYSMASKELNSKQALQDVIDRLQKGYGDGTIPPILGKSPGPFSFGRAVEDNTFKQFGSKTKDLLTPDHRALVDELRRDLTRSQQAMATKATIGSPTAPYIAGGRRAGGFEKLMSDEILRQVPLGSAAMEKLFANANEAGRRELVKMLQNPEILAKMLEDARIAMMLTRGASRAGSGFGGAFSEPVSFAP